jgi:filamentous hemagglutinin family protein
MLADGAHANPLDGAVSTGSALISSTSKITTVDQKSEGVVIDWSSFNIASGQTTNFVQPNSSAIAVNRIGSASASRIMGTLDANGRIVLINGNGLLFGKGTQVNVGSLVATSTDGTDQEVLAGHFTKAGNQNASIVNNGRIDAATHGTVALVAPNVSNFGIVRAKFGTVALGAGNRFTVDFNGDGLATFATQGDVNGNASVTNTGRISGATVSMTAHAAEGLATGVVNAGGVIEARGEHQAGGIVTLDAGNGSLTTRGMIDAAGVTGHGKIETSGANVDLGGTITAGKGGHWIVDPENLTVDSSAATTIDNSLDAGTAVTLKTTSTSATGPGTTSSGPGDIIVTSALSWDTTAKLTLDAYHSVIIDASVSATKKGTLTVLTDDGGTGGILQFNGGNVTFANLNSKLTINGASYILVSGLPGYLADIAKEGFQNYALAASYTASGTYHAAAIAYLQQGIFEGLGNTISNLKIVDTSTSDAVGLFGTSSDTAVIRDLNLTNVSIRSASVGNAENPGFVGVIGGLIGQNNGILYGDYVSGTITATGDNADVGGLAGMNVGTIDESHTDITIKGDWSNAATSNGGLVGGLVGISEAQNGAVTDPISNSSAVVDITVNAGALAGGLIGSNDSPITDSYATGTLNGKSASSVLGGLVGSESGRYGGITGSYAAVKVAGGADADVGGLVGNGSNSGGASAIEDSYATGSVSAGTASMAGGLIGIDFGISINTSYATGAVTTLGYSSVGGFAGESSISIENCYATGNVKAGIKSDAGGFVGTNDPMFFGVAESYSTGTVTASTASLVGGFIGWDVVGSVAETNSYWDTTTSKISQGTSSGNVPGIMGLTTVQFQSGLPTGFSSSVWGENASIDGGLPYLLSLPPA